MHEWMNARQFAFDQTDWRAMQEATTVRIELPTLSFDKSLQHDVTFARKHCPRVEHATT